MPADNLRAENHTLLVQLSDGLGNLGKSFETFAKQQQDENRVIHKRIDETDDRVNKGISDIKESLAKSGKVSSVFIFALCATLLSLATCLGGLVTSYVNVRLENVSPVIAAATARITEMEKKHGQMEEMLHTVEINAERNASAHSRDIEWLQKARP